MTISYYESPLGLLQIKCENKSLISIEFYEEKALLKDSTSITNSLVHGWLENYFVGEIRELNFSLSPAGTNFQKKVWDLLFTIPFGKTQSYKQLSQRYGDLKAIRAVARANGVNPIPIIIPCHRIIGSNGSLVGFSGGLKRKNWLLKHEAHYASGVRELFK